jgi:DNA-binding response OmpR family regulator
MTPRVMVIEDEPALARGLCDNLADQGFDVKHVAHGDEAEAAIRAEHPDVVVLDLLLPGRSGLDVLKGLRASGDATPVLVLTARSEVVDRVVGLELGADDYLGKPFAIQELIARVRALLRRASSRPAEARAIRLGDIEVDFAAMEARGPAGPLDLTPHDLLVLEVLARRRGEVVSRADIVEEVCGLGSDATLRTVDNHVVALRRALEPDARRPRWLVTVRGQGYRLARE